MVRVGTILGAGLVAAIAVACSEAPDGSVPAAPTQVTAAPTETPTTSEPSDPGEAVAAFDFAGAPETTDIAAVGGIHEAIRPYVYGMMPQPVPEWTWDLHTLLHDDQGRPHLRIEHREGKKGPGLQMNIVLDEPLHAARYEWQVMFEEGFSWGSTKEGGKSGALQMGALREAGDPDRSSLEESASARVTWGTDGMVYAYVTHLDQPGDYSEKFETGYYFEPGKIHSMALTVDVRTGLYRLEMDDHGVIFERNFRWPDDILIERVRIGLFHGGGTDEFGPTVTSYSRFYGGQVFEL